MSSKRIFLVFLEAVALGVLLIPNSEAVAQRGGFGFSIGGGGGHHSSDTQWGVGVSPHGMGWGVNVPLGSGDVRLGVGNYGYSPYYRHYYWNDPNHLHGYNYYQPYSIPSSNYYSEASQYGQVNLQEPPPLPTAGQLARLSDAQLRQILADAVEGYLGELDGFNTGESWKKHFQLAEVLEQVNKMKAGPLDVGAIKLLAGVLSKMDAAVKKSAYSMITEPYGFRLMHAVLREYTLPVFLRQEHLLNAQVQILKLSLDGLKTGEGWKKHFELDFLDSIHENLKLHDPAFAEHLEKILAKFDAVVGKDQYRVITEQEGFLSVRTSLQSLINAMRTGTAKLDTPPPPVTSATP
jgi:hypothetical protein